MTFQSQVNIKTGFGNPGEIRYVGPTRAKAYQLDAVGGTVGNAFTLDTVTSLATQGGAIGGTKVFAGILANPKEYASFGGAGVPLSPTLIVPGNAVGDFLIMGEIVVHVTGPVNVGDQLLFDPVLGTLSSGGPAVSPSPATMVPNAVVERQVTSATGGLTVIRITN